MGLETATYVADLVSSNPLGSDAKAQGDDHIRLLKSVLQATFPALAGAAWRVQSKGSGYTVLANDNMSVIEGTATLTLDLTAAATLGNRHLFFVIANGGNITIDPAGAETINGAATVVVSDGNQAIVFCDGTKFFASVIGLVIGSDVQAHDVVLDDLAALGVVANNEVIVGTGAGTYAHESGATLLTSIGAQVDLDVPSQAEAEAGTSTAERVWTAERVKQAIEALGVPVDVQTFNSDDTWTKPSGAKAVYVQAWGGGGSGAKRSGGGSAASGGGGGGYDDQWFDASDLGATEAVTVGPGGAAVSGTGNGNDGGDTSFGLFILPEGGKGGLQGSSAKAGGDGGDGVPASYNAGVAFEGAAGVDQAAGVATYRGGASGGGAHTVANGFIGGNSVLGGAGGGGAGNGGTTTTTGAGGVSIRGGDAGDGSSGASEATDGTVPGGGGGALNNDTGNSGAGADGRITVTTYF